MSGILKNKSKSCKIYKLLFLLLSIFVPTHAAFSQTVATKESVLRGVITLESSGAAARNASVTIAQLKRATQTDENGRYEFRQVPSGKYDVIVHLDRVPDTVKTIELAGDSTLDFQLSLAAISEQVTVTASGFEEAISSAYQSVISVGALELAEKNPISLGEALDNQAGVAKRSFGPASSRPVIRGFDGDRVLVVQDGLRIGGIASQSGDEVEPIDVLALDRVEIVKGPATLLYGSNAIGGVVNGISSNEVFQKGLSGYLTAFGGTNNWQAGGNAGLKFGFGKFMVWANGGGQKANDYQTPAGAVFNSFARGSNAGGGAGWFSRRGWFSFGYNFDRRRYGIPAEAGAIDTEFLKMRRDSYTFKSGFRELDGFIEAGNFSVSYNDYVNREFEFESDENHTELESLATNKNFNYRAVFDQKRRGKLSGAFGFSGFTRDYNSVGSEAPAPRTKQNSVAVYALERLDFERVGFQFGGRVEQNGYKPDGDFRSRNFTGFSGGIGMKLPLWTGGLFVANYSHSFRAPALEELYNNGPHPGILVFDIGNQDLKAEQGDGIDFSLRHNNERFRLNAGAFFYNIKNFVYLAYTGKREDNLPVAEYAQGNAHYAGAEARLETKILRSLWFESGVDYVRAGLTDLNKPLPRIPPLRFNLGLDWRYKNLSVRPEAIFASKQNRIFENETPTAGYAVFNLNASYTFIIKRAANIFAVSAYNLGDKLYRNHLSFIKQIAPEIGRGVRFNYTVRF